MKSCERGACNCCENLQSIIDKRQEVRRRDHRQLPRQASPSQCDVRRDDGELYDVHGGCGVQGDDVSWARDVSARDGVLPFDVLGPAWARNLYHRAELPLRERRELHRQGREP